MNWFNKLLVKKENISNDEYVRQDVIEETVPLEEDDLEILALDENEKS